MNGFIEWLAKINEKDSRARAVLRRSLTFDPGEYPAAFPYVEPFLKGEENVWRRRVYYLTAGLWAQHWRQGAEGTPQALARACFEYYLKQEKSPSMERRFITLLDSDGDQLPYRLRQMTALLKETPLNFEELLKDLLSWNHEKKWVQNRWAQDFYRNWQQDEEEDEAVDETNMAKEAE
jgi:CRISPR system Cascade subunit CasB